MRRTGGLWCGEPMSEAEVPMSLMRPHSGKYGDAVTDAAIPLLARQGASGVTLRSLADALRMTPSGIRRWFGSIDGTWQAITLTFGRRWVQWLDDVPRRDPEWIPPWESRGIRRGPTDYSRLALPLDESEVAATRAWLSMCEHARQSDELAQVMAPWLEHETRTIGRLAASSLLTRPRVELDEVPVEIVGPELTAVTAVVHGLRHQMVHRQDPLEIPGAQAALKAALTTLLGVHARA